MTNYLKFITLGVLSTPAVCMAKEVKNQEKDNRPNVILLVVDDMGYNDMSFRETALADVKKLGTPAINSFAESGIYFANAYATCPVSSPARNGIITGKYQERWGNYTFGQGGLSPHEDTIAEYLQRMGYATKHIGKVHLNGGPVEHPMDRGFDEFMGFINHSWDYIRLSSKDRKALIAKGAKQSEVSTRDLALGALWRNREPQGADFDGDDSYTTRVFTDEAVGFIEEKSDKKPFFLTLAYNALHNPTYVADKEYAEKVGLKAKKWDRNAKGWDFPYWDPQKMTANEFHKLHGNFGVVNPTGRLTYLSHLLGLDDSIARIRQTLKAQGQLENTILIMISDNGGEFAGYSNNDPLNGQKYMMGEGGIRVPFIISYPDKIKKNKTSKSIVSAMDIFPTIVEYTGGSVDGLDGVSLTPVIKNTKKEIHDVLVWDFGTKTKDSPESDSYAVRKGKWKLTNNLVPNKIGFKVNPEGIAYLADPLQYAQGISLHDLEKDPQELVNLADSHPEIVEELRKIHATWRLDMMDPVNMRKKVANKNKKN